MIASEANWEPRLIAPHTHGGMITMLPRPSRLLLATLLYFSFTCYTLGGLSEPPATIPGDPQRTHSLAPRGKPGPELLLASGGKTSYVIRLKPTPTPQEQRAAEELAKWLDEMTGATFPVRKAGEEPPLGVTMTVSRSIWLGDHPSKDRRLHGAADLGDEGYAIDVVGEDLYLTGGRRRGPLYAVFALLEEDLGCRWYARGTNTIPRVTELRFRPVPRHYVPRLLVRDPYSWDAFDRNWSLRNRTCSSASLISTDLGGDAASVSGYFVHTFNRLVPPDKYFGDHPEYFSLVKGVRTRRQLCMTNAEVLKITIDKVRRVLDKHADAKIISVSPNDDRGDCECDNCKSIWDREGTPAGPLLAFVNSVADAIKSDHPGVRVSTLAYLNTYRAPSTLRPRPNVVIQLCTDRHSWGEPFLPVTETENFQNAIKSWRKLGAVLHIWDYTVNFSHYPIVMPNLPIVADNIRFYLEHGAEGVMLQGDYQSPGGDDGPLKAWVWAKQLWDPSRDTRSLIRDFVEGYYGPAAPPLQVYQDQLWSLWERECHRGLRKPPHGIRYAPTLPVFSDAFLAEAWTHLDEAARLAAGDAEASRRVMMASVPVMYADLCAEYERIRTSGRPRDQERYHAMVARFEAVAQREHITHITEGRSDITSVIQRFRTVGKDLQQPHSPAGLVPATKPLETFPADE